MKDERKSKLQLINELREMRARVDALEKVVDQYGAEKGDVAQEVAKASFFCDQLSLGYQSLDETARICFVNNVWTTMMGYSKAEVIGRWFGDFVAPEEHERLREEFAAFKVKGEVQDVDRTLIRADGSRLIVSINGRVSHDNEGSLRTHCILKDITLQKRDDADLRESERRFRALAENIDDVFWMSSPGVTEQIYVSPAYERIWGRPVKEVLSVPRSFMDSIHPDDRADFITMVEEYHALCKAYEHEYRIIKPDGQVRWIRERGFPVKGESMERLLMAGICSDVTEQKHTEISLRRSESRSTRAQELAQIGDWTWEVGAGKVYWSEALYQIFGMPKQEVTFEMVRSLVHPEDLKLWEQSVWEAVKQVKPIELDFRVLRPDGAVCWIRVESEVETDADGKPARFFGTAQNISERKNAELALKASEQKYRLVSENIPVVVYSALPDENSSNLFLTGRIEKLTGHMGSEFMQDPTLFNRMIYPEDRKRVWQEIREHRRKKGPLDVEYRIVTKQGILKWIRDHAVPSCGENGEITRIDGYMEDVTKRKRTEEELNTQSQILKRTFAALSDVVLVIDPRTHVIMACNQAVKDIFGYGVSEVIGRSTEFLHVDQAMYKRFLQKLYQALDSSGCFHSQFKMKRRDGTVFISDHAVSEFRNETGERVGVVSVVRDVTQHQNTEQALRESEEWFRTIFEAYRDAIFITGDDDRLIAVNQAAADLTGYSVKELTGMANSRLHKPEDLYTYKSYFQRAMAGEVMMKTVKVQRKDGTNFDIEFSIQRIEIGGVPYLYTAARDITRHKQAEEEVRVLSRRLARLQENERRQIAREMHDRLGQTLTALNMTLTAERDTRFFEVGAGCTNKLETCLRMTNDLGKAIEDLMGELSPPVLDDYGLVPALAWHAEKFQSLTGLNTRVQYDREAERPTHEVELGLFRIVQEALTNVAKHAEAKSVRIVVETMPNRLVVSVIDDGKGFTLKQESHKESTKHWGLAIMRERARALGGKLQVETQPGGGTRIVVEVGLEGVRQS